MYRVIKVGPLLLVYGVSLCLCVVLLGFFARIVVTNTGQKQVPIYSVDIQEKKVAMGINCAWGNEDIPQLLEILDRYQVQATFFVVGDWCDRFPQSVRQIYDAGHEIGSHSDTHADMTRLDEAGRQREIRDSSRKIQQITGQVPLLFRPPSGAHNSQVVETVLKEGMIPIQWDCDSIDYRNPTPQQMKQRILKKMRPGSIMLFHSGAKNTPAALPDIIQAVQQQGFEFVIISQLIYPAPYQVDFEGRQYAA